MIDQDMAKRMILAPLTTEMTESGIREFAKDVKNVDFYSVIVDEFYISLARELFPKKRVGTIISYPLGGFTTETNVKLIERALSFQCSEIDVSPKFNYMKSGKWDLVKKDLEAIVKAVGGKMDIVALPQVAKMTFEEIEQVCRLFLEVGIKIIKTNSGFWQGSTAIEHVKFIRRVIGKELQIEVSGGVRTKKDAEEYIEAGVDRIHSSTWKNIIGWTEEDAK